MLDSLLIASKARKLGLSDEEFDLDNPVTLHEEIGYYLDIPLCSKAYFVNKRESFEKMYKRCDWDNDKYTTKSKIGTGSGKYKNYIIPLKIFYADEVYFYCLGNEDKIRKLLEKIYSIGKKNNSGYGIIGEFAIEEIEEVDFLNTENPLRPLPVSYFEKKKGNTRYKTYKFPYFYKANEKLCYV
jgi:CRISPR type IV-associated protein Csf3